MQDNQNQQTPIVSLFTASYQPLNPYDEVDEDLLHELND